MNKSAEAWVFLSAGGAASMFALGLIVAAGFVGAWSHEPRRRLYLLSAWTSLGVSWLYAMTAATSLDVRPLAVGAIWVVYGSTCFKLAEVMRDLTRVWVVEHKLRSSIDLTDEQFEEQLAAYARLR